MSSRRSPLQYALASPAMVRLLLYFALHPDESVHVRELRRRTDLAMASLQNELGRLLRLGLITREQEGRRIVYHLDVDSPGWPAFRALIRQLADPAEVIREAFTGVEGVDAAFVFGSHARGDTRDDSDVDLFVLGREDVHAAVADPLSEAESLLGRDVDVVAFTHERALQRARSGSDFLRRILSEPKRWVAGDPRALAALEAA
jgi:predicted nucleotidyltransferase